MTTHKGRWRYAVSTYANGLLAIRTHHWAFSKAKAEFDACNDKRVSATLTLKDGSVMQRCVHE